MHLKKKLSKKNNFPKKVINAKKHETTYMGKYDNWVFKSKSLLKLNIFGVSL